MIFLLSKSKTILPIEGVFIKTFLISNFLIVIVLWFKTKVFPYFHKTNIPSEFLKVKALGTSGTKLADFGILTLKICLISLNVSNYKNRSTYITPPCYSCRSFLKGVFFASPCVNYKIPGWETGPPKFLRQNCTEKAFLRFFKMADVRNVAFICD